MTKDRFYLVGTAVALLAGLFAAILFPVVRNTVFWLLIGAACWLLLLITAGKRPSRFFSEHVSVQMLCVFRNGTLINAVT